MRYRQSNTATKEDTSRKEEPIKKEKIKKEESEHGELMETMPEKGAPRKKKLKEKPGQEKQKGWWLCKNHGIWISPWHPLY